jgi:transposase
LNYDLLFRWFVGMDMDEVVWNHAVFSKNRERLRLCVLNLTTLAPPKLRVSV